MYQPLEMDLRLAAALPNGALFAVGGRVRDELRASESGRRPRLKDLDYVVTGLSFSQVQERLSRIGRVDLVGASFAVFKVTADGLTVDVALPRRERSVGTGHRDFSVESGPEISLEDDLARRDFRINMIARALPSGEIVDPFGGAADIAARRIDILTPQTFEEDPLRMLRAAQFAARFGYTLSEPAFAAMCDAAHLVRTVSPERIGDEFTKMFVQAPKPSIGLELLRKTGILAHIWPELLEGAGMEQNEWHAYDVYQHNLHTLDASPPGDLIARLSALLHDVGKSRTKDGPHFYRHEHVGADMGRDMLTRLRFSNEVVDRVEHLIRQHMYSADPGLSEAGIRRFVRRIGVRELDFQFALRAADIAGSGLPKRDDGNEAFQLRVYAEVARKPAFSIADLRIGGAEVMQRMVALGAAPEGFRGDRRVGQALQYLFEQVTEQPGRNEPQTLTALLDQYLGGS
ncbi:MAG TPA: HD domain-containing protein [Candidatus Baltobacteraceae bacterium]|nr:HD domain-containing protein [Candidatus Baltobacteraceae bacterium]